MRILYHHRTLGDGAEGVHIDSMVKAFRSLGHDVKLLAPVQSNGEGESSNRGKWFEKIKKVLPRFIYELAELAYGILGTLWAMVHLYRHKPHFIYDRYITFNLSMVWAGKLLGVPVFLEVNAPLALERSKEADEGLVFKTLALWLEGYIARQASFVFAVSTPLREHYIHTCKVLPQNIMVLANGVDLKRFKRTTHVHHHAEQVVGFVGIMRAWHGPTLLVEAMAQVIQNFPMAKLLLVGDGSMVEPIYTLAEKLGIRDHINITGRVPHAQIPMYVSQMTVAVSPKATFYASPMKIVEYMAMGVPVIAPDMPNIHDLIVPNVEGLLFIPESAHSLAGCIEKLLASSDLCLSLGSAAYMRVCEKQNWETNARIVIDTKRRL